MLSLMAPCRSNAEKEEDKTSPGRSQLDRLLDPENIAVSLETISRIAKALGKRVII
jgi:hypothetical protein